MIVVIWFESFHFTFRGFAWLFTIFGLVLLTPTCSLRSLSRVSSRVDKSASSVFTSSTFRSIVEGRQNGQVWERIEGGGCYSMKICSTRIVGVVKINTKMISTFLAEVPATSLSYGGVPACMSAHATSYRDHSTSKLCTMLTCSCSCRFRESASSTTTWSLPVRRESIRSRTTPDRHSYVTVGLVDGFHILVQYVLSGYCGH